MLNKLFTYLQYTVCIHRTSYSHDVLCAEMRIQNSQMNCSLTKSVY
jgi:hypothetical protein